MSCCDLPRWSTTSSTSKTVLRCYPVLCCDPLAGSTSISTSNCAPMYCRLLLRQRHAEVAQRLPVPILVVRVVEESPCCSSKASSDCHLSYSRVQGATHATFRYTGRQEFFVYTARSRGWFELWAKMHTLWQPLMNTGAIHAHYITFFVIYMRLLSVLSRLHSNQRNSCKTWCWTTLYRYTTSVYIILLRGSQPEFV